MCIHIHVHSCSPHTSTHSERSRKRGPGIYHYLLTILLTTMLMSPVNRLVLWQDITLCSRKQRSQSWQGAACQHCQMKIHPGKWRHFSPFRKVAKARAPYLRQVVSALVSHLPGWQWQTQTFSKNRCTALKFISQKSCWPNWKQRSEIPCPFLLHMSLIIPSCPHEFSTNKL